MMKNRTMLYAEINGVEIFATGKHNGETYDTDDLDEMIRAFNEMDFQPPLKLGHDDSPGVPAVGYISRLWRNGNKLLADFVDINERVFALIKEKAFNRVSAEIYFNFERAGKKYRRALKALALLGATIPAVSGLKPLSEIFAGNSGDVHFSTEGVWHAASAAQFTDDLDQSGDVKMDQKEIDALLKRAADADALVKSETEKREAAEKALADAKKHKQDDSTTDLAQSIAKLTGDQKAARIAELVAQVAEAEKAAVGEREARERAEVKLQQDNDRIKKLEEANRRDRIEKLAETCRIPALRGFIRQYADLATRGDDVQVYDAAGNQKSALVELEETVVYINKNAARIFGVVSTEDPTRKSEANPGNEVDRRAKLYQSQHQGVDYRAAMRAVLEADPQLKSDYAA